ncbi:MAG: ABC transporter ATP-binding protein [Marivibrio sp.]|uniref:ABC transporter ATP-binding protein n=1 Tax=Marivibrio sp. TaxID=2039719 RepID=UPI0032EC1B73
MSMIALDGLTKRFGGLTAVDGITLSVARGEVLGFLGPNGAGKSTTMKMVTGYLAPSAGRAEVCGIDVAARPVEAQTRLGYLPEGAPAWPDMTPQSFLSFIAAVRGIDGRARVAAIGRAAERASLGGVMRQPIETLSKGYKRRVGLAQALLHDPEVLILDEPTDGLDPNQKQEVRRLINEMRGDKAIVISTHILEEVEAICTRAVVIGRGRLLADGAPQDLERRDPQHNAVRVTLAEPGQIKAAEAAMARVSGVGAVAAEPGEAPALLATPRAPGGEIAAEAAAALREAGIGVNRLEVLRGRLDFVFRELTR